RLGWLLLAVLALALLGTGAFLLLGEPLRTGIMLASKRGVLIGAMIVVGVVGLVWALQIVLANLAHTTRERLAGAKRYLALALAALMVVAVAVPATRGVQSLWALQGLVGSRTVFGGGGGGDHPFTSGEGPWAVAAPGPVAAGRPSSPLAGTMSWGQTPGGSTSSCRGRRRGRTARARCRGPSWPTRPTPPAAARRRTPRPAISSASSSPSATRVPAS